MSHVSGSLEWNLAVFRNARKESNQLILELADGSSRFMKYENWDGTVERTEKKIFSLKPGAAIRVATWGGWDSSKWFCDVEIDNS